MDMDVANNMKNNNISPEANIFQSLCEHWNEPLLFIKENCFVECNQAAVDILSLNSKTEIYQMHPSEISPEYQPDGILSYIKAEQMIAKCYENGMHRFPWMHQNKFKELFWVEVTVLNITLVGTKYILCSWRDITDYRNSPLLQQESIQGVLSKAQQYEFFQKSLTNNTFSSTTNQAIQNYKLLNEHKRAIDVSAIVSKTDRHGFITYVNDKFCKLSGYSVKELIGNNHNIIKHPDTPAAVFKNLWSVILKGDVWQGVIKNKNKSGKSYYVNSTICPISDVNGSIKEFIAIRYDVTDIYHKNLIIKNQNTDPTTQLCNATKLFSDINKSKKRTLVLIKIKELMDIQQAYGFPTYNEILLVIAKKLQGSLDENYNLYRGNDDVFAILISEQVNADKVTDYCENIQREFERKFIITQDNEFFMTMKVGIALNCLCENVYNDAQKALINSIKSNQSITIYSDKIDIQQQLINNINWSKKLKSALIYDDIKIFGQNIYDVHGDVYSTEVLMRYFDKDTKEYISPFFFLKFAEKAQLYTKLSMRIIEKSCKHFSNTSKIFSFNLTMNDIKDKVMSTWIIDIINQYKVGKYLTIELVESTDYELESDYLLNFLDKIKSLGCKIAIDDFGSGYSNFGYLMRMPVDIIKIDGTLIKNMHKDKKAFEIVKTIIQFCKSMDLKVVTEYVETIENFELLKSLNADYFQGYYFHKPALLN